MEVNRVLSAEDAADAAVNKVHGVPLRMAKARVGAAVTKAIEGRAQKEFGSKSLISEVCSGEKVPEYLARIVDDKSTRRKLALALLEDDTDVIVTTNISIRQRKAG